MASSPVTAPSTDSPPTPPPLDRATPPTPSSSTSSPPPTPSSSSPPPTSSSSSPPPTSSTSPPPPPSQETPPPPQQTPPPPPATSQPPKSPPSSPPTSIPASPPPPRSTNSSAPPPPSPSKDNNTPPTPPPASKALSPPPPTHRTPPSSHTPTHSKSPPPPSHNESSSTEKLPLIIGVTVGVGILLIVMIIIFVSCAKKKKRRPHDQMQYYSDPSRGPKGSERYNNSQHPNWHNSPQSIDYVVKLPPPPGAMGPPGGGWPAPPPPTHMTSSSEMSSNYSGPHHPPLPPPSPNIALGFNKSTFSYDELAAATNGFTQTNLLGQGGFGYVHKGVLANGKEIAVKSLKSGSGQGEREFQAEVEIISRVHHRHLVSLVGYCIAGGQRLLVYEFVPNKTLEYHLYGKDLPTMDWPTRLRIALGSAKGLAYLHEDCHPRIIHRDIKAANILLDYNFEAMVADFGLAKLSSDNYTHVSTRVMGTFGYLAPEYASSGKLTEKSDVFSYGVMLLELITGRRPVDSTNHMEDSLVDWARPILTRALGDGNYDELVDPRLENKYSSHEMAQMVACAAASIRHSAKRRPKMSQIVRALEGDVSLEDLNEGFRPGQSSAFGSTIGSEYDTSSYNADMKKFRKMALASQEMGSSDYGATSDYGLNHSSSSSNSREMNQTGDHRHIP